MQVLGFMNVSRYKPGGNYSSRYRTEEKMSHTETQRHGEERDMFLDNDRFGVPRHLSPGSVYGSQYEGRQVTRKIGPLLPQHTEIATKT